MFLALFLTCFVGLVVSTVLLLTLGKRTRFSSRAAGLVLGLAVAAGSGELSARIWNVRSADILIGEVFLLAVVVVMVAVRPQWNPIGQLFFAAFLASILAYLRFAIDITLARGLPLPDAVGSALLLLLELIALTLSASFAFESCDVICRTRPSRPAPHRRPPGAAGRGALLRWCVGGAGRCGRYRRDRGDRRVPTVYRPAKPFRSAPRLAG